MTRKDNKPGALLKDSPEYEDYSENYIDYQNENKCDTNNQNKKCCCKKSNENNNSCCINKKNCCTNKKND